MCAIPREFLYGRKEQVEMQHRTEIKPFLIVKRFITDSPGENRLKLQYDLGCSRA